VRCPPTPAHSSGKLSRCVNDDIPGEFHRPTYSRSAPPLKGVLTKLSRGRSEMPYDGGLGAAASMKTTRLNPSQEIVHFAQTPYCGAGICQMSRPDQDRNRILEAIGTSATLLPKLPLSLGTTGKLPLPQALRSLKSRAPRSRRRWNVRGFMRNKQPAMSSIVTLRTLGQFPANRRQTRPKMASIAQPAHGKINGRGFRILLSEIVLDILT